MAPMMNRPKTMQEFEEIWRQTDYCKRGHKRTKENTYLHRNKNEKSGWHRVCRRCSINRERRRDGAQVQAGDPIPPRNAKRTDPTCRNGHPWPLWLKISRTGAMCLACRRQRNQDRRTQARGGTPPSPQSSRHASRCIHGHPWPDNLWIGRNGKGNECRMCSRIRQREKRRNGKRLYLIKEQSQLRQEGRRRRDGTTW